MGVSYLAISAGYTVLSFVGLACWTELSLDKLRSENLTGVSFINLENGIRDVELLSIPFCTIALLVNCVFNVFILVNVCVKTIFFGDLYPSETRKLVERLINYVIHKGLFLPLVIPHTIVHGGLWVVWLTVLCSLKMFQALARDRLERLNASPCALPWTYFCVYSVLLLVLAVDVYWITLCLDIYRRMGSTLVLLLFFEPLSVAFETMQALLVHGFQLFELWLYHSAGNSSNCQRFRILDAIRAGSFSECKGILIRNLCFSLDMATLLMALGHYVHIWWLHGMAFHIIDAILFLNLRALLSAIIKRIKGFLKLRRAFGALHAALPDATLEELQAYDDECAICREPMARAKKLHCSHLFHLACLRSWLDQGLSDNFSCPTCRKPLFVGRHQTEGNLPTRGVLTDERLAHQISDRLDQQINPALTVGVFPNETRASMEGDPWRSTGLDSSWPHTWPGQGLDGAGPSAPMRSVGFNRVQMMMRHLANVGETYTQNALEDASWSLWPINPSHNASSGSSNLRSTGGRYPAETSELRMRTASRSANNNIANILTMAETVREVLPHIPDELIFEDLQQTNSVTVTVNNLLQL
ncbi:hypothetical protein K2173_008596 [Erythroxylum novogranatense]|uniref:RING-type E3 ubiquitin transferase n=1 Tax=Erythroxylum novogranatense TaxID=1862640 RepID=A0AAV8SKR3_9ROSI|nr:hypothetical protein K2173_008596 [Erythroxylum novogranatense]